MRRFFLCSLTAVIAVNCLASGADATIKRVHHEFEAAMMKNNMAAARKVVVANFSKDFQSKSPGGSQNLDDFIKNLVPPGKLTLFRFDLGKITQKGDTATLSVTVNVKGSATGRDGKAKPISATEVDKETWKQVNGAWKMVVMEQVDVKRGK